MTAELYTTMTSSLLAKRDSGVITPEEFKEKFDVLRDERDQEEIAEMQREWKAERLDSLIKNSELGRRFQSRTFENFNIDDNNKHIYELCLKYAKNFKEQKREGKGLLFIGTVGTGKTHLSAAIANYIINNHIIAVKFGSVTTLLSEIKSTYGANSKETEAQVIRALSNVDLLVIDDLGKENTTEWSNSIIYSIINSRYEGFKPTIFTTNLQIKELEQTVGEATVSRLIEMCDGILMNGIDHRKIRISK